MKYGFVIDQRKCIGCHACTVACKAEHDVPIGVYRTWVKYIEKGEFPNTRRHFLVTRCNHCDDAPCVAVCPTKALFKRADGIVDFDRERCIGCKSCMQACPYDALYIDPETHTAAKCNYCAHRVDQGLQPACVVVCPVQAIIAGDLEIRRARSRSSWDARVCGCAAQSRGPAPMSTTSAPTNTPSTLRSRWRQSICISSCARRASRPRGRWFRSPTIRRDTTLAVQMNSSARRR